MMWNQIAAHLSRVTGDAVEITQQRSVGGGCINQAYVIETRDRTYFVKLNQAAQVAMFEAEFLGLQQMAATGTIRVPQPLCWGTADTSAYLVLEWIEMGRGTSQAWQQMGRNLAGLHQVSSDQGFGWLQNNTIGSTPQINSWTSDWTTFWAEQRLGYQFQVAQRRGGHFPLQGRLLSALPELLADHHPQPALVHGDLWSGNAAVSASGEPLIFDPAAYFGDREVDIAMTELFGGFPPEFYQGYNQVFPLDSGYKRRKTLYNLYHILNHFNIFGGSYQSQANRMIEQILSA